MSNNKILFVGNFKQSQTKLKFMKKSTRKVAASLESRANSIWIELIAKAKSEGNLLWDQEVYRLENFEIKQTMLNLNVSTIPFSIRYAMNSLTEEVEALGPAYYPMALYTSIYIRTSDDKYIFLEKSNKFVSRRKFSFIGGVYEKNNDQNIDIFDSIYTELSEEIGITKKDIVNLVIIGGFINKTCNVCIVSKCDLSIDSIALRNIFDSAIRDGEARALIIIENKDQLSNFLNHEIGVDNILDIFLQSV